MILGNTDITPKLLGFEISREVLLLITTKVSNVKTVLLQAINIGQKLPGESNSFSLEIVAKRPITQHLEEGVMVRVHTNIIQIIMLATYRDQTPYHLVKPHTFLYKAATRQ